MHDVQRYLELVDELMTQRRSVGLTDKQEAKFAAKLDDIWQELTPADQEVIEEALSRREMT